MPISRLQIGQQPNVRRRGGYLNFEWTIEKLLKCNISQSGIAQCDIY